MVKNRGKMIIKKKRASTRKEIEEEYGKIISIWYRGREYFDLKILEDWLPWKASTIRQYIQSGKIRGIKVKGKWLVSRASLYKYLEGK